MAQHTNWKAHENNPPIFFAFDTSSRNTTTSCNNLISLYILWEALNCMLPFSLSLSNKAHCLKQKIENNQKLILWMVLSP